MKKIRMGCGSASWGDMLDPAVELMEKGELDYMGIRSFGRVNHVHPSADERQKP